MFPGSMFVYMLRDGRSVVESLRNFVNPVEHDEACRIWRASMEAGIDFRDSERSDRIHVVPYEDIVEETDREVRRIYEFLELEHEPRSVGFIRRRSPINSSFKDEDAVGKLAPRWSGWSKDERRTFHSIAGDLLVELEFEADDSWIERHPVTTISGS